MMMAKRQAVMKLGLWTLQASAIATFTSPSFAQIAPDATLAEESSSLIQRSPIDFQIEGGSRRDINLFHSFSTFNIENGGSVYFANPNGVENIFTRVTGNNISHIQGTLGVNGNANLFLLNPHGIIFGRNARLDIQGSFVATTADAVQFGNIGIFSVTNPQIPSSLLSVNPSAFFLNQISSGKIVNQSQATDSRDEIVGLQVPIGKTLGLIGGEIDLIGGNLTASGGRIELTAIAPGNQLPLQLTDKALSLNHQGAETFKNITFSQNSRLSTSGQGGGTIQVWGENIFLNSGSRLEAQTLGNIDGGGINIQANQLRLAEGTFISNLTLGAANSDNLNLHARESIELIGAGFRDFERRFIAGPLTGNLNLANLQTNAVLAGTLGVGRAGDIIINTPSLLLKDGAIIANASLGTAKGGNIDINASSVAVIGSGLGTLTLFQGAAGNLNINTKKLSVRDGSAVSAITFSAGKGGNLNINASEYVEVASTPADTLTTTGLFTGSILGTGAAGDITIDTQRLYVRDTAQIFSGSGARVNGNTIPVGGPGGNLIIRATELVEIRGKPVAFLVLTALASQTYTASPGGNITIDTGELVLQGNTQITSSTLGSGRAGNLVITAAESAKLLDGAQIASATFGLGKAGNITISTDSLEIAGSIEIKDFPRNERVPSGLFVSSQPGATGDAGDMIIDTEKLILRDRGVITSQTLSTGKGGTLIINAQNLQVLNAGVISSSTASKGRAGDLTINSKSVQVSGTTLDGRFISLLDASSSRNATGDAANLTIHTGELFVNDRAAILVSAQGSGNAGNLEIDASSIRLDNQARLDASTTSSNQISNQRQANISLRSRELILRRNSNITTNATGSNVSGGNIDINTNVLAALENSDISANSSDFQGGRVTINAQAIFGTRFRNAPTSESDITATGANSQLSGTVQINTPEVDPSQGLTQLPEVVIDPASLVGQNPCQKSIGSSFVVTGRGGLPSNPSQTLIPSGVRVGLVEPTSTTTHAQSTKYPVTQEKAKLTNPIVEAQGWVVNDKGEIILTADNLTGTNHPNYWQSPTGCSAS